MMTISQIISSVEQGTPFQVNLMKRTVRLGKQVLCAEDLDLSDFEEDDPLLNIEINYVHYKYSIPSERSDSKQRHYFNALPEKALSADDLLYGEDRESAQARLELHLLACILSGALVWDEKTMGTWFWQSKSDPDLVILRQWIEPQSVN